MSIYLNSKHRSPVSRLFSFLILIAFSMNVIIPPAYGQMLPGMMALPSPTAMIGTTPLYVPALIRGIEIHPENPLQFDFIIDTGHSNIEGKALEEEATRMVKYFLAALTVPEKELWVNLSPYEKDRVIPQSFGQTDMGMDLLAQDYILKQLTASLMYPEKELGKKFWDKVRSQAKKEFGTSEIPMDNFNKVWIVPEKAAVYETGNRVFVVNSHLKVLMEQDYLAANAAADSSLLIAHSKTYEPSALPGRQAGMSHEQENQVNQIMKEIVIPAIEKEVNEGAHFARLRQINQAAILAKWYKQTLKESLLGKVYVDQAKVKGIDTPTPEMKEEIYQQYVEAFKKGVYDYIKEDVDPQTNEVVPHRYFSGGAGLEQEIDILGIGAMTEPIMRGLIEEGMTQAGNVVRSTFALVENLQLDSETIRKNSSMAVVGVDSAMLAAKNLSVQLGESIFHFMIAAQRDGLQTGHLFGGRNTNAYLEKISQALDKLSTEFQVDLNSARLLLDNLKGEESAILLSGESGKQKLRDEYSLMILTFENIAKIVNEKVLNDQDLVLYPQQNELVIAKILNDEGTKDLSYRKGKNKIFHVKIERAFKVSDMVPPAISTPSGIIIPEEYIYIYALNNVNKLRLAKEGKIFPQIPSLWHQQKLQQVISEVWPNVTSDVDLFKAMFPSLYEDAARHEVRHWMDNVLAREGMADTKAELIPADIAPKILRLDSELFKVFNTAAAGSLERYAAASVINELSAELAAIFTSAHPKLYLTYLLMYFDFDNAPQTMEEYFSPGVHTAYPIMYIIFSKILSKGLIPSDYDSPQEAFDNILTKLSDEDVRNVIQSVWNDHFRYPIAEGPVADSYAPSAVPEIVFAQDKIEAEEQDQSATKGVEDAGKELAVDEVPAQEISRQAISDFEQRIDEAFDVNPKFSMSLGMIDRRYNDDDLPENFMRDSLKKLGFEERDGNWYRLRKGNADSAMLADIEERMAIDSAYFTLEHLYDLVRSRLRYRDYFEVSAMEEEDMARLHLNSNNIKDVELFRAVVNKAIQSGGMEVVEAKQKSMAGVDNAMLAAVNGYKHAVDEKALDGEEIEKGHRGRIQDVLKDIRVIDLALDLSNSPDEVEIIFESLNSDEVWELIDRFLKVMDYDSEEVTKILISVLKHNEFKDFFKAQSVSARNEVFEELPYIICLLFVLSYDGLLPGTENENASDYTQGLISALFQKTGGDDFPSNLRAMADIKIFLAQQGADKVQVEKDLRKVVENTENLSTEDIEARFDFIQQEVSEIYSETKEKSSESVVEEKIKAVFRSAEKIYSEESSDIDSAMLSSPFQYDDALRDEMLQAVAESNKAAALTSWENLEKAVGDYGKQQFITKKYLREAFYYQWMEINLSDVFDALASIASRESLTRADLEYYQNEIFDNEELSREGHQKHIVQFIIDVGQKNLAQELISPRFLAAIIRHTLLEEDDFKELEFIGKAMKEGKFYRGRPAEDMLTVYMKKWGEFLPEVLKPLRLLAQDASEAHLRGMITAQFLTTLARDAKDADDIIKKLKHLKKGVEGGIDGIRQAKKEVAGDFAMLTQAEILRMEQSFLTIGQREYKAFQVVNQQGWAHLLADWDSLTDNQKAFRLQQIEEMDWKKAKELQERELDPNKSARAVPEGFGPSPVITTLSAQANEAALALLTENAGDPFKSALAFIMVGGGSGSAFESLDPKGTLPGTALSRKSLFESLIKKIQAASRYYGHQKSFPIIIMTSDLTHEGTQKFLEAHDWFGAKEQIILVKQAVFPLFDQKTRLPYINKDGEIAVGANGHGDAFDDILVRKEVQEWLKARGVKAVQYLNIDNPLNPLAEKTMLGELALSWNPESQSNKAHIALGVIARNDINDRLGLVGKASDGEYHTLNYGQASDDVKKAFTYGDPSFRVAWLESLFNSPETPYRVDAKPDKKDDGRAVFKLEKASDDKERRPESPLVLLDRIDTFEPIKKPASKADKETDATAYLAQSNFWKKRLQQATGIMLPVDMAFEISDEIAFYMTDEELRNRLLQEGVVVIVDDGFSLAQVLTENIGGILVNEDWTVKTFDKDDYVIKGIAKNKPVKGPDAAMLTNASDFVPPGIDPNIFKTKLRTELITGGSGFISASVIKRFMDAGVAKIIILDKNIRNREEVSKMPGVEILDVDLADINSLRDVFFENQIDHVTHLAADIEAGTSMKEPAAYFQNNVLNTIRLLDVMKDFNVKGISFASSAGVYEGQNEPLDENVNVNPQNVYGATKRMMEKLMRDYSKAHGIRFAALRFFNVAGAFEWKIDGKTIVFGENHRGRESHIIPIIFETLQGKRPFFMMFGDDYDTRDGSNVRDYIHVLDLANAIVKTAAWSLADGQQEDLILNLGTGEGTSNFEMIAEIEKVAGKKFHKLEGRELEEFKQILKAIENEKNAEKKKSLVKKRDDFLEAKKKKYEVDAIYFVADRRFGDSDSLTAKADRAQKILGWGADHSQIDQLITDAWKYHSQDEIANQPFPAAAQSMPEASEPAFIKEVFDGVLGYPDVSAAVQFEILFRMFIDSLYNPQYNAIDAAHQLAIYNAARALLSKQQPILLSVSKDDGFFQQVRDLRLADTARGRALAEVRKYLMNEVETVKNNTPKMVELESPDSAMLSVQEPALNRITRINDELVTPENVKALVAALTKKSIELPEIFKVFGDRLGIFAYKTVNYFTAETKAGAIALFNTTSREGRTYWIKTDRFFDLMAELLEVNPAAARDVVREFSGISEKNLMTAALNRIARINDELVTPENVKALVSAFTGKEIRAQQVFDALGNDRLRNFSYEFSRYMDQPSAKKNEIVLLAQTMGRDLDILGDGSHAARYLLYYRITTSKFFDLMAELLEVKPAVARDMAREFLPVSEKELQAAALKRIARINDELVTVENVKALVSAFTGKEIRAQQVFDALRNRLGNFSYDSGRYMNQPSAKKNEIVLLAQTMGRDLDILGDGSHAARYLLYYRIKTAKFFDLMAELLEVNPAAARDVMRKFSDKLEPVVAQAKKDRAMIANSGEASSAAQRQDRLTEARMPELYDAVADIKYGHEGINEYVTMDSARKIEAALEEVAQFLGAEGGTAKALVNFLNGKEFSRILEKLKGVVYVIEDDTGYLHPSTLGQTAQEVIHLLGSSHIDSAMLAEEDILKMYGLIPFSQKDRLTDAGDKAIRQKIYNSFIKMLTERHPQEPAISETTKNILLNSDIGPVALFFKELILARERESALEKMRGANDSSNINSQKINMMQSFAKDMDQYFEALLDRLFDSDASIQDKTSAVDEFLLLVRNSVFSFNLDLGDSERDSAMLTLNVFNQMEVINRGGRFGIDYDFRQRHTLFNLTDKKTGNVFSVMPDRGFTVTKFSVNGERDVFYYGEDLEKLRGIFLLGPWVNRLDLARAKEAGFDIEQLMQSDPVFSKIKIDAQGNANHGVLRDLPWTLDYLDENKNDGSISIGASVDFRQYPMLATMFGEVIYRVTYTMKGDDLSLSYAIENVGTEIAPAFFGAHPCFNVDVKNTAVKMSAQNVFKLNDRLLPDGQADAREQGFDFLSGEGLSMDPQLMKLETPVFLDFATDQEGFYTVQLHDASDGATFFMSVDGNSLPYFVLWNTDATGRVLGAEPMSIAADHHNQFLNGNSGVAPGKTVRGSFRIHTEYVDSAMITGDLHSGEASRLTKEQMQGLYDAAVDIKYGHEGINEYVTRESAEKAEAALHMMINILDLGGRDADALVGFLNEKDFLLVLRKLIDSLKKVGHLVIQDPEGVGHFHKTALGQTAQEMVDVLTSEPKDFGMISRISPMKGGILVVDDDADFLILMQRLLARGGFQVQVAKNGREALEILDRERDQIRVMVTDFNMPGMNGVQLSQVVGEEFPDIPVVIQSADIDAVKQLKRPKNVIDIFSKDLRLPDKIGRLFAGDAAMLTQAKALWFATELIDFWDHVEERTVNGQRLITHFFNEGSVLKIKMPASPALKKGTVGVSFTTSEYLGEGQTYSVEYMHGNLQRIIPDDWWSIIISLPTWIKNSMKKDEGGSVARIQDGENTMLNARDELGGIDLNPEIFDLQIKRDGNGVPLPLSLQPVDTIHIEGFYPVLIQVVPVSSLPMLMGFDAGGENREGDESHPQQTAHRVLMDPLFGKEVFIKELAV